MNTILQIKHFFFIILIIVISLSYVYGQKEEKTKCKSKKEIFAFGPKVSINFTKSKNNVFPKKYGTGADLGLFFRLSPLRLYIQPEIIYQIRNTDFNDIWNNTEIFETHHIDIPIFIGIKAINFKLIKLRFFAGPEFNIRLKNNGLSYYGYQLGFQAGLGLDLWRFTIDAGYSFLGHVCTNNKIYSNMFKVGVGFKCF